MKILKEIKKCRGCSSNNIKLVLKLAKTPIGEDFRKKINLKPKKYKLDLYQCKTCGLAQIKQVVNPKLLYNDYLYQTNTSTNLKSHFKQYAKDILKYLNIKKKITIVDLGSNDGTFLENFKFKGHNVIGVEPARKICNISKRKKIFTINSFFNKFVSLKIIKKFGYPEIVTANNVLANVDNLDLWIKNIVRLIDNEGVFIFESFSLLDLIKNKVVDFIYHEHLSIFSAKSIKSICERNGLKLFHIQRVSTKGGSFRYFITSESNKKIKITKSIKRILNLEIKYKIFKKLPFINLKNLILKNKKLIHKHIKSNYIKGKKIIGVGASISCITLKYQLNLENKINYLIDDNDLKNKMFSPGKNIPIIKTSDFQFSKNNILIILAWRFKDYIFKRHFKKIKGTIIDAWPKVKKYNKIKLNEV